ncbi:MAG: hypothetical protein QM528_07210 [Phycisphaerales bacterium]|nr:hypothetical protein [Phycisphaerales bacterium]
MSFLCRCAKILLILLLIASYHFAQSQSLRLDSGVIIRVDNGVSFNINCSNVRVDTNATISGAGVITLDTTYNGGIQNLIMHYGDVYYGVRQYPIFTGFLQVRNPYFVNLIGDLRVDSTLIMSSGNLLINSNILDIAGGVSYSANNSKLVANGNSGLIVGSNLTTNTIVPLLVDASIPGISNGFDTVNLQNGNLDIESPIQIVPTGVVVVANGVINTNNNVLLASTTLGTARVGVSNVAGNYINGNVQVQRYFDSTNAFRLVTAPFMQGNSPLISQSWQLGTPIYGPGGASNGFTPSPDNDTSMYYYDNTTAGLINPWQSVPNTNATYLADYSGYLMRVYTNKVPTILNASGFVNQGNQFILTNPNTLNLIQNPFPAPIDFDRLYATNQILIKKNMKQYDPALQGPNGLGGFVTFSWDRFNQIYDVVPTSILTRQIQSGQSFFVEPINNGYLSINEQHKSSFNSNVPFVGSPNLSGSLPNSQANNEAKILVNLNIFQGGLPQAFLSDAVLFGMHPLFSTTVSNDDAIKLFNVGYNIATLKNGVSLAIDRIPPPNLADTLFFNITGINQLNTYQLSLNQINLSSYGLNAYLLDKVVPDQMVNLPDKQTVIYNVVLNPKVPSTYAPDRFCIVFNSNTNQYINLQGSYSSITNSISLQWTINAESNIKSYQVEKRGINDINTAFVSIATVTPRANDQKTQTYNFNDLVVGPGNNVYRINALKTGSSNIYSPILNINVPNIPYFSAYPNPFINDLTLKFENAPAGKYSVEMVDALDRVVATEAIEYQGGKATYPMNIKVKLGTGMYFIRAKNGKYNFVTPVQKRD